jgi:hypothetical protein
LGFYFCNSIGVLFLCYVFFRGVQHLQLRDRLIFLRHHFVDYLLHGR